MIVPDRDDGKRRSGWGGYKPVPVPRRRLRQNGRPFTASLAQVIMLPDFSQGGVKLQCETEDCCLKGPVCYERRIPQPPALQGSERIGPLVLSKAYLVI